MRLKLYAVCYPQKMFLVSSDIHHHRQCVNMGIHFLLALIV